MSLAEGWYGGRLRELSREECLEVMATKSVGRVAYCDGGSPVVLPVNFALDGDTVVFRTAPHNMLGQHLRDGEAAFEVDEVDEYSQSGWSVLLRGRVTFVDPTDLPSGAVPEPWPEGVRTLHVRITPHTVTGRRLLSV